MSKWPDLRRHGWRLSLVRRAGKVSGVRLERTHANCALVGYAALRQSGFVVPVDHGRPGYAVDMAINQLRLSDLQSWLPAFDPAIDYREMEPLVADDVDLHRMRYVDPRLYPEEEDVLAVDSEAGISAVEMSREVFDDVAQRRTLIVSDDESESSLLVKVLRAAPHLTEREARSAAYAALAALGEAGASLHALDQVGSVIFSPVLRFYRENHPGDHLAHWAKLQQRALQLGLLDHIGPNFCVRFDLSGLNSGGDTSVSWEGLSGSDVCRIYQSFDDADVRKCVVIHEGLDQSVSELFLADRERRRSQQPSLFAEDGWRGDAPFFQLRDETPEVRHWATGLVLRAFSGIAFDPVRKSFVSVTQKEGKCEFSYVEGASFEEAATKLGELTQKEVPGLSLQAVVSPKGDRIEDVGEKIGGARKDFYRSSLKLSDLDSMNDREMREALVLGNVWPFSPKQMKEEGGSPAVATFLRDMRRRMHSPKSNWGESTIRRYVAVVSLLHESLVGVKTGEELIAGLRRFRNEAERSGLEVYSAIGWRAEQYVREFERQVDGVYEFTGELVMWSKYRHLDASEGAKETAWKKLLPARQSKTTTEDDGPVLPSRPHLEFLRFQGPIGEDIETGLRDGQDVAADELLTIFGFRGVEFGNWLPQDERQRVVNYAYDGLMLLAKVLNVAPSALSLNGSLALAFGARGVARAAAHYEPARRVINLTRMKGAGSLAHEFWHALDDALGQSLGCNGYATKKGVSSVGGGCVPGEDGTVRQWLSYVMDQILKKPASEDSLRKRFEASYARGVEYAKSWIKWDLVHRYQEVCKMDRSQAIEEADGVLSHVFESVIEESKDAVGGFDYSEAASRVLWSIESGYKVKLKKQGRDQVLANLRSSAHAARSLHTLALPDSAASKNQLLMGNKENSVFFENAKKLDGLRSSPYWSTEIELSARAFESYVYDRLEGEGMCSDYLVHGVEGGRFSADEFAGNPYPSGTERESINQAFDGLMVAVRRHMEMGEFTLPKLSTQVDAPRLAASL